MHTAKVCVIGDFAVGKTSTTERFVNNVFSEKYLTTVGVKIDTRTLDTSTGDLKLVIWDVAGTDRFSDIEFAYTRGSAGFIVVADGTRKTTVDSALRLHADLTAAYGNLPFVALLNKSDLSDGWEIDDHDLDRSRAAGVEWRCSSAKTGENVEQAITALAEAIMTHSGTQ